MDRLRLRLRFNSSSSSKSFFFFLLLEFFILCLTLTPNNFFSINTHVVIFSKGTTISSTTYSRNLAEGLKQNKKCCCDCCCCKNIDIDPEDFRKKLAEVRNKKKHLISGQIYVRENPRYGIDGIPQNIDVLTVSFIHKQTDCTQGDYSPCGNIKELFRYKGNETKTTYLEHVKILKKKNPDLLILLEVNDNVIYKIDPNEAFKSIDNLVNFLQELQFDGINFDISVKKLLQDLSKLEQHVHFYTTYIQKLASKMGKKKILAITTNATGAFSNLEYHHGSSEKMTDDESPFNPTYLKRLGPDDAVYKLAATPTAGVAIPIIHTLGKRIDIVAISENLHTLNEQTTREYTYSSLYQSYFYYGHKYKFTLQIIFDLNNEKMPLKPTDKKFLQSLANSIKAENAENHLADGFGLLGLGFDNPSFDEKQVLAMLQELFS